MAVVSERMVAALLWGPAGMLPAAAASCAVLCTNTERALSQWAVHSQSLRLLPQVPTTVSGPAAQQSVSPRHFSQPAGAERGQGRQLTGWAMRGQVSAAALLVVVVVEVVVVVVVVGGVVVTV